MDKLFEFDSEDGLFDDYGSDSISYNEEETEIESQEDETLGEGKRVDKIFDNNFGQIEYESTTISFNVDPSYHTYTSHDDELDNRILYEEIDTLIKNSEYAQFNALDEFNKVKKLNKLQINKVYTFVIVNINTNHRKMDVFSILSDYFDIYPNKFYSSLSNKYKNELIMELDQLTNVLEKRKIRKLF